MIKRAFQIQKFMYKFKINIIEKLNKECDTF